MFLLATVPGFAAADCPSAHIVSSDNNVAVETFADRLDTVFVRNPDLPDSLYAGYDLARGESWMRLALLLNEHADLETQDDFRIEGLPQGAPIDFVARLSATADWEGAGTRLPFYEAELGAGPTGADSNHVRAPDGHSTPWSAQLALPLRRAAGEDFRLHVTLDASNSTEGGKKINLAAKLYFEGLPPGSSIVSCHGYRQESGSVPAAAVTWGSIKARYR
jgi:hypothetical protein